MFLGTVTVNRITSKGENSPEALCINASGLLIIEKEERISWQIDRQALKFLNLSSI